MLDRPAVSKLRFVRPSHSPWWLVNWPPWPFFWTNEDILKFYLKVKKIPFKKMHLKTSSAKWRPFCLGLNMLTVKCRNKYRDIQTKIKYCMVINYILLDGIANEPLHYIHKIFTRSWRWQPFISAGVLSFGLEHTNYSKDVSRSVHRIPCTSKSYYPEHGCCSIQRNR